MTTRKTVVFILLPGTLLLVALIGLWKYNFTIPVHATRTRSAAPVEEWIRIGFTRCKLEDAYADKTVSRERYETGKQRLSAREDEILLLYPRNAEDLKEYFKPPVVYEKRPAEFWISLAASIVTSLATLSGLILAWRNDRRVAAETELKLLKLTEELSSEKASIIIS